MAGFQVIGFLSATLVIACSVIACSVIACNGGSEACDSPDYPLWDGRKQRPAAATVSTHRQGSQCIAGR